VNEQDELRPATPEPSNPEPNDLPAFVRALIADVFNQRGVDTMLKERRAP